jgi:glycosyltransferase involved in cell wall biosynthesis
MAIGSLGYRDPGWVETMAVRYPLVSVCIPCFNAERYVEATLESVFRQTYPAIEVVVVDDGSTDRSLDRLNRFSRPNLKIVSQVNVGQSGALNTCLAHASGEFVQYLDADDLIAPHKIMLQVERLAGRFNCVASAEWGRFRIDPAETIFAAEPVWCDLNPLDWLARSRSKGLGMMYPALWLIPRKLVNVAGPWCTEFTMDNEAEYFTRVLLKADRVLFCEGARTYYRSGIRGSVSGQKSPQAWESQFKVLDMCEGRVLERENSDRMRRGFSLAWQTVAHASYPYAPKVAERALARAESLHPIRIRPDGGRAFKVASRLVGWRLARRMQVMSGRP